MRTADHRSVGGWISGSSKVVESEAEGKIHSNDEQAVANGTLGLRRALQQEETLLTSSGIDLPAILWRNAGTFSISSAISPSCFSPPICSRQTATP